MIIGEELTLGEFIKSENLRLAAFHDFWIKSHKVFPKLYPNKLGPGDWDEMLMLFHQEGEVEPETNTEV